MKENKDRKEMKEMIADLKSYKEKLEHIIKTFRNLLDNNGKYSLNNIGK